MNVFAIIVILIVALIIVAIVVNAVQQHKEKVEAGKRSEIAKQKAIIDETEDIIIESTNFPISQKLKLILNRRILNALQATAKVNPAMADLRKRIKDTEARCNAINVDDPLPAGESFSLPGEDKMIIKYIQGVKKLRILLRSEHSKGKVEASDFTQEDKMLENLQLKVNVGTLAKRGNAALKSNMLGSARQYFEKAINAMAGKSQLDESLLAQKAQLEQQLSTIQENLRNVNAEDAAKKQKEEKDDLDELFAPKKKW